MDLAACEAALRDEGFSVKRFPEFVRLVRSHCEVHVSVNGTGVAMRIPVAKAPLGEVFPERLLTYLRERNASPKGPGLFEVVNNTVWCGCEIPSGERDKEGENSRDAEAGLAAVARQLVAQVERLGPKILNLK